MRYLFAAFFFLFANSQFSLLYGQNRPAITQQQCATMDNLVNKLSGNPTLKKRYEQQLSSFNQMMRTKPAKQQRAAGLDGVVYTVPIVFHIVLTDPSVVTDAQIIAQLKILNEDFAGANPDSVGIPSFFKPLHGKSNIQFCLAQRTPDGDITNGIERTVTTKTTFSASDNGVKHASSGGVDLWDETKYYNVWVCVLGNNILGYATFPTDGETTEQGVAIHYESLPGGSYNNYNGGKTLTHETGHYFNLYHIWGDDDGACTGSDFINDTPNQANSTSGCYSGVHTDSCTPTGNGILYEDYMDYSNDQCLLLFTPEQVDRMETALQTYRSSLLTSDGCTPAVLLPIDAQAKAIVAPVSRVCNNSFSPAITIRNRGSQTLTSLTINTVIDNATPIKYNWTGSLASRDTITVSLNSVTVTEGIHKLQIFVASPNGTTDQNTNNDTLVTTVQYYAPVKAISESFEGATFPPPGWDIVNPDKGITWKKVTNAANTGSASVMIDNFDYSANGQMDYLRMPSVSFVGVDSAFLTFQVAAAAFTPTGTDDIVRDTLHVLLSTDCGATYTSLYKKWGASLVTHAAADTSFFIPTATEWRKDSINLTPYINIPNVLLAFSNTTEFENNIYLDDVNVRTITINPNLKATGFLVTPNPTHNNILVQFYPNPANLVGIQLYNLMGQKLSEIAVSSGQGSTLYNFDINRYPAGIYMVRAVFTDKVLMKKIVKE